MTQSDPHQPPPASSPTEAHPAPHRVLIIGLGGIGERHLRCFGKTGKVQAGAFDTRTERLGAMAERYGCATYNSLDEALAADRWHAAVVCTPAPSHLSIARKCLELGMHTLIEKPLAIDIHEADAFSASFNGVSPVVRVGYVLRCLPPIALAKTLLQQRDFGPLKHITASSGQNFPTFRPDYREIYYARHETGGGAIQDALTHVVNAVEWMAGPVTSLLCDARHQVLEGVEVEDTVSLATRHEGGTMATLALNQFQAPNEMTISLHAPRGSLKIETHHRRVGEMALGDETWTWHDAPAGDRDAPFIAQAHEFLAACAGQPSHLATLKEGIQTMKVNLAALRGAVSGRRERP